MSALLSDELLPFRDPFRNVSVRLQRRKHYPTKASLTMDEDALVVAEIAKLVGFDFVFLGFGVIDVAFAGAEAPGTFDYALFANEVGGLDRVGLVGGTEDHAVAEVEGEDF